MSNKLIILSLITFLLLSFGFLAYVQTQQQSPLNQNFWTIYFENPKDDSLSFFIENNDNEKKFHWEMSSAKGLMIKDDIEIKKGEKQKISIKAQNIEGEKIIIRVNAENKVKEIYKIIEK
jgi:hypothetical protein